MHCGHLNNGLVMFFRRVRFSLQSDSRRTLIWKAPGTRYRKRTPLNDTVTVVRDGSFGEELFLFQNRPACSESNDDRPHLSGCHFGTACTFVSSAMGAEFLFMDDNARPHLANLVDECLLQSEDITRMDWPAYSPDLNPIEHV
ncbi:DDE_3 domain-containing protein [Trichonephila clavipes]|nr:DDE_3 domain-containing protein [Trichonephila clavipes]